MSDHTPPPLLDVIEGVLQYAKQWAWRPHRALPYLPREDMRAYFDRVAASYDALDIGDGMWVRDIVQDLVVKILASGTREGSIDFGVKLWTRMQHLLLENDFVFDRPMWIDPDAATKDELQAWRERLALIETLTTHYETYTDYALHKLGELFPYLMHHVFPEAVFVDAADGMMVPLCALLKDPAEVIKDFCITFISEYAPDGEPEALAFRTTREQIITNILHVSGLTLDQALDNPRRIKWPSGDTSADELVSQYLAHTALAEILRIEVPFVFADKSRFEHHHIVAASGAGKSNFYGELLLQDLERVGRGEASVVVLDHSGKFIEEHLVRLKLFAGASPLAVGDRVQVTLGGVDQFTGGTTVTRIESSFVFVAGSTAGVPLADVRHLDPTPAGPLHDRLVYIDPTDVDYPIQLNIFGRSSGQPPQSRTERDRQVNRLVSMINFVFSALDQQATGRQRTLLQAVAHILLAIPNSNLDTLNDLFEPPARGKKDADPLAPYRQYLHHLEPQMQKFCEQQFNSTQFSASREQIAPRIQSLIVDSSLYRMFSATEQKLDLAYELNRGAAVIINCKKDVLQDSTEVFGRFFIALLRQAINARADIPEQVLMPTFVYIDECHTWIANDPNVQDILETARKFKVGILLAHQAMYQIGPKVSSALQMTAIKMAARPTQEDVRSLAAQLRTTPDFIQSQPTNSFAVWVSGVTPSAISLKIPVGRLHTAPKMTDAEFAEVRALMRAKYAATHMPGISSAQQPPANGGGATKSSITSSLPPSAYGASSSPAPSQAASQPEDDINTKPSTSWRRPPPQ